jgi:hypothetical protein
MVISTIQAISTTEDVRNILNQDRNFGILNVFEHACNLITDDGQIVSIVSENTYHAPFNLIVPLPAIRPYVTDGIYRSEAGNLITPIVIFNLENAHLWDSTVPLDKLPNLDRLITLSKLLLTTAYDSLAQPYLKLRPVQSALQQLNLQQMGAIIDATLVAIAADDDTELSRWIPQIAGHGMGLTPAGDDWLVGCMLALHLMEQENRARKIAAWAIPKTTPLSAAWLHKAAERKYSETWHQLLQAETTSAINHAICIILAQGQTSGADALTGFVQTLETLLL